MLRQYQRFKSINEPKKFVCHAGVVPFVYASGQYKGKAKTCNKANTKLKALLNNAGSPVAGYVGHTIFARNQSILLTKDRRAGRPEAVRMKCLSSIMFVISRSGAPVIHRVFSCVHRKKKYKDFYSPLVA